MKKVLVLSACLIGAIGCKKEEKTPAPTGTTDPGKPTPPAALGGRVTVDGSSTVFPITEAVAEEFQKGKKTQVTVGISGTGGGFKKFCSGEIDIADASRPIKATEVEACQKAGIEYVELPIAYDGLAVMVNPKNSWATSMTVEELKRLWEPEAQAKIMKWSQVREGWPDKEIHLFGAGVDSGTYDYFTEAVVGKQHASRGDFTSSEDDNVIVQGIATDESALGFFGYAYYSENKDKLKLVAIDDGKPDNGAGPIEPSPETVKNNTYQPLSRPIFIYVSTKALERPEVAAFIDYYLTQGPALVSEVGYIQLPEKAYTMAADRVKTRKTGSMFAAGSNVGMSIEELLGKEAGGK